MMLDMRPQDSLSESTKRGKTCLLTGGGPSPSFAYTLQVFISYSHKTAAFALAPQIFISCFHKDDSIEIARPVDFAIERRRSLRADFWSKLFEIACVSPRPSMICESNEKLHTSMKAFFVWLRKAENRRAEKKRREESRQRIEIQTTVEPILYSGLFWCEVRRRPQREELPIVRLRVWFDEIDHDFRLKLIRALRGVNIRRKVRIDTSRLCNKRFEGGQSKLTAIALTAIIYVIAYRQIITHWLIKKNSGD